MDGNEPFVNARGGIAKLCKACQLYDPFQHHHNLPNNISTYIRGTKQIDFILVSYNILKKLIQCGMTAFNELTTTDHRGLHLDLSFNKVMKQKANEIPSPFDRQLQSKCPTSVRFYKTFLEKKITKQKLEEKVSTLLTIAQKRILTKEEDDSLNKLDNQITMIMLNAEKKINCKQTSPWSPELHIAIRTVTLWKLTLTQLKTKVSQHKNILAIQNKLKVTINLDWQHPSDIFHHLKLAQHNLIQIRKESSQLRTNYLLQRASAMDVSNNTTARNTIININKIEQIIKMWRVIQYTTSIKSNSSIQTIDVPTDTSIPWNNIKGNKNVIFKTIDNPRTIE